MLQQMMSIMNFEDFYFTIPASRGCSLKVVCTGKNTTLMLENLSLDSGLCEETLSTNSNSFRCCFLNSFVNV